MGRQVIRVGDATSHGGRVTRGGAPHFTVDGVAVALQGDPCSCPHPGHRGVTIAEGDPHHTIGGIPVAYEGHRTTCGAVLEAGAAAFTKA